MHCEIKLKLKSSQRVTWDNCWGGGGILAFKTNTKKSNK